ncbi:MAG: hypothetical protein WA628_17860 [Terriglobales bacterium]
MQTPALGTAEVSNPEAASKINPTRKISSPILLPRKDEDPVNEMASEWTTYRTRFLIKARQLEAPLTFIDCIGREHSGQKGDYLVLSSDGTRRIAPREIFEDIYVPMIEAGDFWPAPAQVSNAKAGLQVNARALQSQRPQPRSLHAHGLQSQTSRP